MAGTIVKDGDRIRITTPDEIIEGAYVATLVVGAGNVAVILTEPSNSKLPVITVVINPEDEWEVLPDVRP